MSCTHLGYVLSENPHKSLRARHFFPATCWKDHKETTTVPVHKNTLAKMVEKLCAEAGVGGQKSNHSLRVTGATEYIRQVSLSM